MDSGEFITQECLLHGFEFDVLEASLDEGQTRSNEPDADVQCSVITDRGRESHYKVQALLKTCIHGVLDTKSGTPASLIIVEYSLSNTKEKGRFSSATISFDFAPYVTDSLGLMVEEGEGSDSLDTPNIVAYAPFEKTARWDHSVA